MIQMLCILSLEIYWKIVGSHYKNAIISAMVSAQNIRTIKFLLIFATICQATAEWNFLATSHGKILVTT